MSETDITPALSAEDWREVLPNIIGSQAVPHQTMAIANAALPDDDPRKITRADVETVIAGAYAATDEFPLDPDAMALEASLHRVAAKLAALLPPE
jgi:hypothetical protein